MITFPRFERYGNLGNQLFQYAAILGLGKQYGCEVSIPRWKWADYFKHRPSINEVVPTVNIEEPVFHYCPDFFANHADNFKNSVVGVTGWMQCEKYWLGNKDSIMRSLEFREDIKEILRAKNSEAFSKRTICISVRRGDYVDNPCYDLLPIEYYYMALLEHFPNWRECNILVFSDDLPYCKVHFSCLDNCYFIEGNPMEQMVIGSMCDDFIIANSTFSWWLAYLGEKSGSKIVRPNYHFAGELLASSDWKDYYPESWSTIFDHKGKKVDLKDVTFTIPVSMDSIDRKENLDLIVCLLQKYFDTNVLVGEQGTNQFHYMTQWCQYIRFDYPTFHRTKMLNKMAVLANTPIIFNYDADIVTPPLQIILAVHKLRSGENDFNYPYDGRFARVDRMIWFKQIEKYQDIGIVKDAKFKGGTGHLVGSAGDIPSVGGVVAFNMDKYIEVGGENENFISYAPEDTERFYRYNKLGYKVGRTKGTVYHIDHKMTINSSTAHQFYVENEREFDKEKDMSPAELKRYADSWGFMKSHMDNN